MDYDPSTDESVVDLEKINYEESDLESATRRSVKLKSFFKKSENFWNLD